MKKWAVILAVRALVAGSAWAVNPMLNQGVRELGVSGSLDDDGSDFGVQLSGKLARQGSRIDGLVVKEHDEVMLLGIRGGAVLDRCLLEGSCTVIT